MFSLLKERVSSVSSWEVVELGAWRRSGCGRVTKQKGVATLDRPEAQRFKPSEGREQGQGPETSVYLGAS